MLHYAGHADYDLRHPAQSGWRLDQGKVTARDILQQGKVAPVPALVFCNACQSGRDGDESAVWASYVLYGDPTTRYLEPAPHDHEAPASTEAPETVFRGRASQPRPRKPLLAFGVGALLLLGSAEPALQGQAYAGLAATAFARGDYQQALDFAAQAERVAPDTAYHHVIRGHIYMNRGQTNEAADAYRTATAKSNVLAWQQAVAYDRLGRIYAAQGDTGKALAAYDQAIERDRDMATVYANKGHVLEQTGNMQDAIAFYRKALDIDPEDPLTTLLLRDAERRQQRADDRDAQARIDRLVDALVQAYQSDAPPAPLADGWTSRQLTLAFVDFQRCGSLSARAGEAEFVMLSLTHTLRASGRVSIVEREVIDKVLAELKLSTSDVVDAQAGLGRGKILAARLLAAGSTTQLGRAGLLSMRLIETETTLINASTVQTIELLGDVSGVIDQVAEQLLHNLRRAYPLRGRVQQSVGQDRVVLNIGAWHGVTPGLVMQVYDDTASTETGQEGAHIQVGRIEVTHVDARAAQALILAQTSPFAPGSKVQEIQQP